MQRFVLPSRVFGDKIVSGTCFSSFSGPDRTGTLECLVLKSDDLNTGLPGTNMQLLHDIAGPNSFFKSISPVMSVQARDITVSRHTSVIMLRRTWKQRSRNIKQQIRLVVIVRRGDNLEVVSPCRSHS